MRSRLTVSPSYQPLSSIMLFLLSAGVLSALPLLWLAPEVAAAGSSSATAAHRAVNVALKTSWSASHPVFELLWVSAFILDRWR